MNSVYVPTHVVLLLTRIARVVSTLSLSHQYILHTRAKAKAQQAPGDHLCSTTFAPEGGISPGGTSPCPWHALNDLGLTAIQWPSWPSRVNWQHACESMLHGWRSMSRDASESLLRGTPSDTLSPPWLARILTWPPHSFLQLNHNLNVYPAPGDTELKGDTPLPPTSRNQNNSASDEDGNGDKERKTTKDNKSTKKTDKEDPFKLLPAHEQKLAQLPPDIIHQLLENPALYDPLRKPRSPIVLCHGLYGFDTRGPASFPSMRVQYWSNVLKILRDKVGAEVIVTSVPGTGSIASRALRLNEQLQFKANGRGINFLAHSMGGLDCRHLITHLKPTEYTPLSLMTIGTPHRGSPFMDWCVENIGIGKLRKQEEELAFALENGPPVSTQSLHSSSSSSPSSSSPSTSSPNPSPSSTFSLSLSSLPSSFTTLLLSVVDSPAYANLTSTFLTSVFNPATPDDPRVKYYSVASRLANVSIWHPFWFPKMVLDEAERRQRLKLKEMWERNRVGSNPSEEDIPLWADGREWGNDGLVTVQSAKWGEFLGTMEGCDHWEMRGARGLEIELPSLATLNSESWSIMDWSRFVNAWRREEKIERDRKLEKKAATDTVATEAKQSPPEQLDIARSRSYPQSNNDINTHTEDAVVKSSTDKLSMVFDWLIDQLPVPASASKMPSLSASGQGGHEPERGQRNGDRDMRFSMLTVNKPLRAPQKVIEAATEMVRDLERKLSANEKAGNERKVGDGKAKNGVKNELGAKEDLERFYVALSRKMYDEGL